MSHSNPLRQISKPSRAATFLTAYLAGGRVHVVTVALAPLQLPCLNGPARPGALRAGPVRAAEAFHDSIARPHGGVAIRSVVLRALAGWLNYDDAALSSGVARETTAEARDSRAS